MYYLHDSGVRLSLGVCCLLRGLSLCCLAGLCLWLVGGFGLVLIVGDFVLFMWGLVGLIGGAAL